MDTKLIGPKDWANKLGVSVRTTKRYMKKGVIQNAEYYDGQWRAPYSSLILHEAILNIERAGLGTAQSTSLMLRKQFKGAFDAHKPKNVQAALPYRIAAALTKAIKSQPVCLAELDHFDMIIREALLTAHPEDAINEAARSCKMFASFLPMKECLKACRIKVESGESNFMILVAASALATRAIAAGETSRFTDALLEYWVLIIGRRLQNKANPDWGIDDETGWFRPTFREANGSIPTIYRKCPASTQHKANEVVGKMLGFGPINYTAGADLT